MPRQLYSLVSIYASLILIYLVTGGTKGVSLSIISGAFMGMLGIAVIFWFMLWIISLIYKKAVKILVSLSRSFLFFLIEIIVTSLADGFFYHFIGSLLASTFGLLFTKIILEILTFSVFIFIIYLFSNLDICSFDKIKRNPSVQNINT
jgi:hypothetical protein